jgi:hypothetical protein
MASVQEAATMKWKVVSRDREQQPEVEAMLEGKVLKLCELGLKDPQREGMVVAVAGGLMVVKGRA